MVTIVSCTSIQKDRGGAWSRGKLQFTSEEISEPYILVLVLTTNFSKLTSYSLVYISLNFVCFELKLFTKENRQRFKVAALKKDPFGESRIWIPVRYGANMDPCAVWRKYRISFTKYSLPLVSGAVRNVTGKRARAPSSPQAFWPEMDPLVEGARPLSDFFSQHFLARPLYVQK